MAGDTPEKILFIEEPPTIVRKGDLFFIQVGPVAVCCTANNLLLFAEAARRALITFHEAPTVIPFRQGA